MRSFTVPMGTDCILTHLPSKKSKPWKCKRDNLFFLEDIVHDPLKTGTSHYTFSWGDWHVRVRAKDVQVD